jgi:hypothetical protein
MREARQGGRLMQNDHNPSVDRSAPSTQVLRKVHSVPSLGPSAHSPAANMLSEDTGQQWLDMQAMDQLAASLGHADSPLYWTQEQAAATAGLRCEE